MNHENQLNKASRSVMYTSYAQYYDQFYQAKDYDKETTLLHSILKQHQAKTILDIGCGTGIHMTKLEHHGYHCEGIDINSEMLDIAQSKITGTVSQADMRNFNLKKQFDAIISMFAVFNHNLNNDDAHNTLLRIKKHLNQDGILILDLYNPQASGEKIDQSEHLTRIMEWNLDHHSSICNSTITFINENSEHSQTSFPLKIYSMQTIKDLLIHASFKNINFYDNYSLNEGHACSKNLIVVAQ